MFHRGKNCVSLQNPSIITGVKLLMLIAITTIQTCTVLLCGCVSLISYVAFITEILAMEILLKIIVTLRFFFNMIIVTAQGSLK